MYTYIVSDANIIYTNIRIPFAKTNSEESHPNIMWLISPKKEVIYINIMYTNILTSNANIMYTNMLISNANIMYINAIPFANIL